MTEPVWHHVVVHKDPGQPVRYFVDGEEVGPEKVRHFVDGIEVECDNNEETP